MSAPRGPISNAAFGRLVGVTHTQMCRIRNGSRNPSFALIKRIEGLTGWPGDEQAELVLRDLDDGGQRATRTGAYGKALGEVMAGFHHHGKRTPAPGAQVIPFHLFGRAVNPPEFTG